MDSKVYSVEQIQAFLTKYAPNQNISVKDIERTANAYNAARVNNHFRDERQDINDAIIRFSIASAEGHKEVALSFRNSTRVNNWSLLGQRRYSQAIGLASVPEKKMLSQKRSLNHAKSFAAVPESVELPECKTPFALVDPSEKV